MSTLKSSCILLKKDSSHKENVSEWEFCEFKVKFVYHIIFVVWADGVLENPVEIGVNTAVKLFCPTQIVVQKGTINGNCNKKLCYKRFFFTLLWYFFSPLIYTSFVDLCKTIFELCRRKEETWFIPFHTLESPLWRCQLNSVKKWVLW